MGAISPGRSASEMSWMMGGPPYPAVSPSVLSTISGTVSGTIAGGSRMALAHPEIGVDHPGVVTQAGKRPVGDDLAEIHHHHLMAGLLDEREVVLDHDDGAPLRRELPDRLADPRAEHRLDASHPLLPAEPPSAPAREPRAIHIPPMSAPPPPLPVGL